MQLIPRAGSCDDTNCPRVFETDDGQVAVQGIRLTDASDLGQIGPIPDCEAVVLVPSALLLNYARLHESTS